MGEIRYQHAQKYHKIVEEIRAGEGVGFGCVVENGTVFVKYFLPARIEYLDGYHASMVIHPREVGRRSADSISPGPYGW